MFFVQGRISHKLWFSMQPPVVLGSQGIVVKCTAAIYFRTVDYPFGCLNTVTLSCLVLHCIIVLLYYCSIVLSCLVLSCLVSLYYCSIVLYCIVLPCMVWYGMVWSCLVLSCLVSFSLFIKHPGYCQTDTKYRPKKGYFTLT